MRTSNSPRLLAPRPRRAALELVAAATVAFAWASAVADSKDSSRLVVVAAHRTAQSF